MRVMRGKGVQRTHTPGDMYLHFQVVVPTDLTERQKNLLQQLASEEKPIEDTWWGRFKKNLFGLSDKKQKN